jgi:hypothetical protein
LHHINFVLKHSCAKTLARKFRLRSRYKVIKKFGPTLKFLGGNGEKSLFIPRTLPYIGFIVGSNEEFRDFLEPVN